MNILKKAVTLKINIFFLLLALLFLGGIAAAVHFHVPENLFFALLRPGQVKSIQVATGIDAYQDLNTQEIAQVIDVLNDFRIKGSGLRTCPPGEQAQAIYHIQTKWGTTLHISFGSGVVFVNTHRYQDYTDVSDRLVSLYQEQRDARKDR